MNKIIFIIIFCILLESTLISYPLTLIAITVLSIFAPEDAILLAFGAGLILDLFSMRILGLSSLYFLSLIYLGSRYRKKIHEGTFLYRFFYLLFAYIIYNFLFYKTVDFTGIIAIGVFGLAILKFSNRLFPTIGSRKRLAI